MPDPYRCTVTFPDGCTVSYTGPDADGNPPRADWHPIADGHQHDPDDNPVSHAVGYAFLDAVRIVIARNGGPRESGVVGQGRPERPG